ncbi:MAG: SDR family NAD(P)-dependent oxidoreductase [Candidatus Promineifilaceae bacterium]
MSLFAEKVVVVTGAGSGIGRVTAQKFGAAGAIVVVSDIDEESGFATVDLIEAEGGTATFIDANVAVFAEVKQLIMATVARFGRIDVAVNNAGIGGKSMLKSAEHTHEDWDNIIAVNQTGVFYCMQLELQQMMQQQSGVIINIASVAGLRGLPSNLAYVASKHAVVGMTKTAAMEYAKYGIRVNAVCPVFTVTNLFNPDLFENPALPEKLKRAIPMKRFAEPSEMADAILYLSSDAASFITGHALPVDGGLTA